MRIYIHVYVRSCHSLECCWGSILDCGPWLSCQWASRPVFIRVLFHKDRIGVVCRHYCGTCTVYILLSHAEILHTPNFTHSVLKGAKAMRERERERERESHSTQHSSGQPWLSTQYHNSSNGGVNWFQCGFPDIAVCLITYGECLGWFTICRNVLLS